MGVGMGGRTGTLFMGQYSHVKRVNAAVRPATLRMTQTFLLPNPSGAVLAAY